MSNISNLLFINDKKILLENMQKICPIAYSKETLFEYLSNILCNLNKNLFKKFQSKNLLSIIKKIYEKQIKDCIYHNLPEKNNNYSFFKDHLCSENNLPYKNMLSIDDHNDEIYNIILSNNNDYIAISLKTNVVLIYRLVFELEKRKSEKIKKNIINNSNSNLNLNNEDSFSLQRKYSDIESVNIKERKNLELGKIYFIKINFYLALKSDKFLNGNLESQSQCQSQYIDDSEKCYIKSKSNNLNSNDIFRNSTNGIESNLN